MPALKEAPHLKPCPFCGCKLESKWNRPNPSARCASENCIGGKLPVLCLDDEGSIDAWNKRTPPTQAAQQEPVAWLHPANATCVTTNPTAYARGIPLYTNQPAAAQRTWVGLTGEDFSAIKFSVEMRFPAEFRAGARWADAYLKQKNGYAEEKNT